MFKNWVFLFFLSIASNALCGQDIADSSIVDNKQDAKVKYAAFPVLFYLPETKLGFGVAGISTFKLKKSQGLKPSQIQFAGVYTLRKQILIFMPFEIYLHKDKTRFFGEIGYYDYFYNYYGQGIGSKKEALEVYRAQFPRLIFSATRRISKFIYLGGQYKFDDFNTKDIESQTNVAQAIGSSGGTTSSLGLEFLYDRRNHLFVPESGGFYNVKADFSGDYTGATYNYQKIELDLRQFIRLRKGHVLASNLYSGLSFGNLPFFQQYFISSGSKLRGFADRRFQDNNTLLLQTEYRYPIYKRFSGVAFYGIGTVSENIKSIFTNPYKSTYGLGLRFMLNKRDKINLRLDYGKTSEGGNLYITVKEAF